MARVTKSPSIRSLYLYRPKTGPVEDFRFSILDSRFSILDFLLLDSLSAMCRSPFAILPRMASKPPTFNVQRSTQGLADGFIQGWRRQAVGLATAMFVIDLGLA